MNIIVLKSAPAIAPRGKQQGVFVDTKQNAGTDKFGAPFNNVVVGIQLLAKDKTGNPHRVEKNYNLLGRGFAGFSQDFQSWSLRKLTQDEIEGLIVVTNIGNAASSGTVTVVDSLPTGLTVTAISGTGWTTNLATLTSTRSDALAVGAAYPNIIVTVSVATNAPASVTNLVTVSGGGETNTVNNTNSDITSIVAPITGYTGTLAGWDVSGVTNYGVSPFAPTTNAPNLTIIGLTRGAGVVTNSSGAARAWGGVNWTNTTAAGAISATQFFTFSLTANAGYKVSCSSLNDFNYRRSGTGATNGLLQYQIGAGAFTDITNLAYTVSTSGGASLGPIDLSTITALQNLGAGTTITFRLVNYGGTGTSGTCYIFDVANSPALDLSIQGTISTVTSTNRYPLYGSYTAGGTSLVFSNGVSGTIYYLQASTNLASWDYLATNTAPADGVIQFTDTQATNLQSRMYRITK